MQKLFFILTTLICVHGWAQYSFSGYIEKDDWDNMVYLSLVEDYRKLSGIYNEQIIAKTKANDSGYFEFSGDMLDSSNRMYRIHVDKCATSGEISDHFNGDCSTSKMITFIANNRDTIQLPFSFENQIFCDIQSTNPKANALVKIDSLKADMRFAYTEVNTQTRRKLNNRKWFKTFQNFGETLNEPLAELYIYSYLSDRTSEFHNYYYKDLQHNDYYNALRLRLQNTYPNSSYTKQYESELTSDIFMLQASNAKNSPNSNVLLYLFLILSLILNGILLFLQWKHRKKTTTIDLKHRLSKRETAVLEQLLLNKSNKDIATALFVSVSTVKTHINNIYKKLDVQSREELKVMFFSDLKKST